MATKLASRSKSKTACNPETGASLSPQHDFTTLMGFKIESEPMPDNPAEVLYTLTHPDLPGMALGDSDPWKVLLCGLDAASSMLRHRMESGEKLTVRPLA